VLHPEYFKYTLCRTCERTLGVPLYMQRTQHTTQKVPYIYISPQASDFSSRVFTTPHMTTVKGTCHITTCELQRVAVCPCVAVWCSVLQRVAACCSVSTLRLKRVTLVNTVRESVAVCCCVLQCVAVCCSVSTLRVKRGTLINTVHESVAVVCSVLQCVTVCYSALQCVAVCPRCV